MKSFAGTLSVDEINAVATFIEDEFVQRKAANTAYHTADNGWPDHQAKYGSAYPFARHELPLDRHDDQLTEDQRSGRTLFIGSCITCHEPVSTQKRWESFPLSHMGTVVREPVDAMSSASLYGLHDRPFVVEGQSERAKAGKMIFDANCAFCHARDGTGKNWIGAFLEPHPRDFTDPAGTAHLRAETLRRAIREGLDGTSMPAWRHVLSGDDIEAVADYIETYFFKRQRQGATVPQ